jgi:hypothetical protein
MRSLQRVFRTFIILFVVFYTNESKAQLTINPISIGSGDYSQGQNNILICRFSVTGVGSDLIWGINFSMSGSVNPANVLNVKLKDQSNLQLGSSLYSAAGGNFNFSFPAIDVSAVPDTFCVYADITPTATLGNSTLCVTSLFGSTGVTMLPVCGSLFTVGVSPTVHAHFTLSANQICQGTSLIITNDSYAQTAGFSSVWHIQGWSNIQNGQWYLNTIAPIVYTNAGSSLIELWITDSLSGTVSYYSENVTVWPTPMFQIIGSPSFQFNCHDTIVTVMATPSVYSYTWMLSGSPIDSSGMNSFTTQMPGYYTVVATSSFGCTQSNGFYLNQNIPPTVMINSYGGPMVGDTVVHCDNIISDVLLNANQNFPGQLLWDDGSTSSSRVVNLPGVYSVITTDQNGCQGYDSVVVVYDTILQPVIISSTNSFSMCEGESIILTAGNYSNYTWSIGGNSASIPINVETTVSVQVSDHFGCWKNSNSVIVTMNQIPEQPTISSWNCELISSAVAGNQWMYYGNTLPGVTAQFINIDSVSGPGIYQVYTTNSYGCSSIPSPAVGFSCATTGISDNTDMLGLDVYPNPFTSHINIQFPHDGNMYVAELINMTGQIISKKIGEDHIVLVRDDISPGPYFVRITSEDQKPVIRKVFAD